MTFTCQKKPRFGFARMSRRLTDGDVECVQS